MLINCYDSLGVPWANIAPRLGSFAARAIEAATMIRGAANYAPVLIGAPKIGQQTIAARAGWRGTASFGKRGYLLGISGYASDADGFKLMLKDLGTGRPLFASPLNFNNITAQANGTPSNQVFRLPRPYLVKAPGQLEIQITSLATAAQDVEIVLHTAQELFDMDGE